MTTENHVVIVGERIKEVELFAETNIDAMSSDDLWEAVEDKLEPIRDYARENNVPLYVYASDIIDKYREESYYYEESSSSYYEDSDYYEEDEEDEEE